MIIFDLDGTLSIVGDRVRYLQQVKPDWDSFYESCGEDQPNLPVARLYVILKASGEHVKVVTGRRESTRDKTLAWFASLNLALDTTDLLMRANGDYREDSVIKPELVSGFLSKIEMVFEDRNSMVAKWRELGVVCLHVADGDF